MPILPIPAWLPPIVQPHFLRLAGWLVCLALAWLPACGKQSDAIVSIALHPTNADILYVATNESVYKTRDGGASWERMATDLSSYRVLSLALDPARPASVYAGTMGDAVYKSPDGGQRWIAHNAGLKEHVSVVNRFVFDPRDSETVYAATTVGVFRSTDGGRLWDERMAGMKEVHIVFTLALDPTRPNIFYAGTSGGAYRSLDGTATWQKVNTGLIPPEILDAALSLGVSTIVIDPRNPDRVYAGTNNGLFVSADRADTWTRIGQSLADQYISSLTIDSTNPSVLYAGGRSGIYKSLDGGKTWQAMNVGLETLNVRTIVMSPHNPETLYLGTNGSGLYRSRDGAKSWARVSLMGKVANRQAGS
ncbi:MAG: WD40/YVTN/BNR-like repeat-containing protein [Nitrospiraceae bacterium]